MLALRDSNDEVWRPVRRMFESGGRARLSMKTIPCQNLECRTRATELDAAKIEVAHWKTCTGHATPEDQYLAWMDADAKTRVRIAELEAALEAHAPNDPLVIEAAERATAEAK